VSNEDWRVEIDLDDTSEGFDLTERLRSFELDDEARERLGPRVYVSRNGPTLFLYAGSEEQAREAEAVMKQLVVADDLTADFRGVTRWHPIEQEWKDATIPVPGTPEEAQAEYERREAAERREVAEQGSYDWVVKLNFPDGDDARRIAESLENAGHPVDRIWRWVTVHVLTEEAGNALISSLEGQLPDNAEIWLEGNVDDPDVRELIPFVLTDPRMY
jgi:hypothetical protein